jgi:hypothetical protein
LAARKDTLEGVELSQAAKKKLQAKQAKDIAKDDGFSCASSIVIMEGPKKNKKKRRH